MMNMTWKTGERLRSRARLIDELLEPHVLMGVREEGLPPDAVEQFAQR